MWPISWPSWGPRTAPRQLPWHGNMPCSKTTPAPPNSCSCMHRSLIFLSSTRSVARAFLLPHSILSAPVDIGSRQVSFTHRRTPREKRDEQHHEHHAATYASTDTTLY